LQNSAVHPLGFAADKEWLRGGEIYISPPQNRYYDHLFTIAIDFPVSFV
jgi:hypothetical protein